ncbi:PHO86 [Candida margitis]|uniref:PHO86 n=1 Tax=Candida margitis TaxID=1775924 RepID=UPI0022261094|nr:PHO86 [Candida margitis]KAI5969466.1 PHO86 [Candida margitis]
MVTQKHIDLNAPLDVNVPSTLKKSPLTPELAKAAITLHGDRYKQSQANLTRYVIWHPYSIALYSLIFPSILVYSLWDYFEISDNLVEFYTIASRNKRDFAFHVISVAPLIASVFGIFGFFSFILGDEVGTITDRYVAQKYCDFTFGFDIKEFAQDPKTPLLKEGKNSELVIYRDQPIAIATIKPDWEQSTPENFIVQITGLHVRKVFNKIDFDQMLIEWAVLRSRELYQTYLTSKNSKVKNGTILIVTDAYSFDKKFEKTLFSSGFRIFNSSYELNPFSPTLKGYQEVLHKLLGLKRDTFGILLTTEKDDVDLLKESDLLEKDQVRKRRH